MYEKGRAWIELSRNRLAHNVEEIQKILPARCRLMPALKANAYGHGAVQVGLLLQNLGIRDCCVASAEEGIQLRRAGFSGQILVLGYTHPELFPELCRNRLTQTVVDFPYACRLSRYGKPVKVHVGIDTGMRRLGERSEDIENILKIWSLDHLEITGVFSHLCAADGRTEAEKEFTCRQIQRFCGVIQTLRSNGIHHFETHLQGSYGLLNYPDLQFDYARVGIALYGTFSSPEDRTAVQPDLRPVLSLKSRLECVKHLHPGEPAGYGLAYTAPEEMRIAAVSIGYGDGIPRSLSGKGAVLVRGVRAPVVGRVCMDQLLIDVSCAPGAAAGDEAVLIGSSGSEEITAAEMAADAGTISNEILSRLGSRPERVLTE